MAKLTILRGVSGSGKSTWADLQAGHPVIVSRDRLRTALFGTEQFVDEDLITKVEDNTILDALYAGHWVIVDDTNTKNRYVNRIRALGQIANATIETKVFDVPLQEALKRNMMRGRAGGRAVPEDVIGKQYKALQQALGEPV